MSPEDDTFQVTLPSNASMTIYPSNKPQLYRTELATPLNLVGKWEVAIVDIQIPHKWKTFEKKEWIEVGLVIDGRPDIEYQLDIEPAYYPDINALLAHIVELVNNTIQQPFIGHSGAVSATYDKVRDRITFGYIGFANDVTLGFKFGSAIWRILGLSRNTVQTGLFHLPFTTEQATYFEPVSSIFIYSDIVKHQLVGDSSAQLIGITPVKSNATDLVYWAFNPILYRPLCKNYIKDIEVQLCTSEGKLLPILQGNTIARLHFRRV